MDREPCSGTRKGAARVSAAANTSNAPAGGVQEHLDRLAIVVVTYKRQELLSRLFDSFATLTQAPWRIIVIDNEASPATEALVLSANKRFAGWPKPAPIRS